MYNIKKLISIPLLILFTTLHSISHAQDQSKIEDYLEKLIMSAEKPNFQEFREIYLPSLKTFEEFLEDNKSQNSEIEELYTRIFKSDKNEYKVFILEIEKEMMGVYIRFVNDNRIHYDEKNYELIDFYSSYVTDSEASSLSPDIKILKSLFLFKNSNSVFATYMDNIVEYKGKFYIGQIKTFYIDNDLMKSKIIDDFKSGKSIDIEIQDSYTINEVSEVEVTEPVEIKPVNKKYIGTINGTDYYFDIELHEDYIINIKLLDEENQLIEYLDFYHNEMTKTLTILFKKESVMMNLALAYSGNFNGSLHELDSNTFISNITLHQILK